MAHTGVMFSFWEKAPVMLRIGWCFTAAALLVLIGSILWHYTPWVAAPLIAASAILNVLGRSRSGRNPQQNDPNRR